MPDQFVHLRLHSEFSIADSVVRIDDVVSAVAADGQGALALTDNGNLFGAVRFYKAARAAGVKPILGADLWVAQESDPQRAHRLLLLVQDRAGYHNLCELLSRAWIENVQRGRPVIRHDWLDTAATQGLVALSGGPDGAVASHLAAGDRNAALAGAEYLGQAFPGRFFIELQRAGRPGDARSVASLVALASRMALPVVATHPVQFISPGDFRAHEARVCIAEGYTLSNAQRPRAFTEAQYLLTRRQMAERFADLPVALAHSLEIARSCNLELELGKPRLPDFPTPPGFGLDEYCRHLASQGLERRLERLYANASERDRRRPEYAARLELELGTIAKMGFSGYFLIVADFINWAKEQAIPVGPGRGSGAGSLAAYSLGITDLDPLRYDLLFERFLNPERVSMPDFDIDFCQDNRDRVIDYVKRKYGAQAVSQIATFGTLGAKAVVRDAGRVLDVPYSKCDRLSKLIPHNPADPWSLERALADEPQFAEAVREDEEATELVALARPLEGLTRNVGMHAGGVLIAPGKLTDFCPLYCAPGTTAVVSQFDKDDVEAIGLVKFDFLGLTTLTILDLAVAYVRRLVPGIKLDLDDIPLDDPATFRIFQTAQTTAIFQFESRGMRDLLKRARPDRLDDLIALNALYRPGPMDLIPDYCDRKHGRSRVDYLDRRLEPILGSTYGIMVYQEQVMVIAQAIGGYSLGGADLLRRAMGKKKPEEMAKHRAIFVEGAVKNGVKAGTASELYDLMEKFAGYGFNKSHSAAYALVAYQTAYLKAHHPAAFMAANMSAVMGDTDKLQEFVADARASGLSVLAPDVNTGEYRFVPLDGRTIAYGLGAIKGTGQAAIEAIVAARQEGGRFSGLFDFCGRINRQQLNRRVVEALVRAGAFDALEPHRAALLATAGPALEHAERAAAASGQGSLFGDSPVADHHPQLAEVPMWSERERLGQEKLALGYYFSGHLFTEFAAEARRIASTRLADLKASRDTVRLAGIVVGTRLLNTRRGRMCAVTLDDGTAQLEVSIYGEMLESCRSMLKDDELLFILGRARFDEFSQRVSVNAEIVMDLAQARAQARAELRLTIDRDADVPGLRNVLEGFRVNPDPDRDPPAGCRVVLSYDNGQARAELALPDAWRVRPDDALLEQLRAAPRVRKVNLQFP